MNISRTSVFIYVRSKKSDLYAASIDSSTRHLRANEVFHTDPKPYAMDPSNEGGSADKIVSKIVDRKKIDSASTSAFLFFTPEKKQRNVKLTYDRLTEN
jgi:hypothetical protein